MTNILSFNQSIVEKEEEYKQHRETARFALEQLESAKKVEVCIQIKKILIKVDPFI